MLFVVNSKQTITILHVHCPGFDQKLRTFGTPPKSSERNLCTHHPLNSAYAKISTAYLTAFYGPWETTTTHKMQKSSFHNRGAKMVDLFTLFS